MKKLLSLLLCLSLLFSLAACSNENAETTGDQTGAPDSAEPSPDGSPSDSSSPSPAQNDGPFDIDAYTQALAGVDADTAMFTVNDDPVTAEYYFYWLSYNCLYYDDLFSTFGGTLDFNEETKDGRTVREAIKDEARDAVAVYVLVEQQAAANHCGLTDEQRAEWAQIKADSDQESLNDFLQRVGLTEDTLDRVSVLNNYLYPNLVETVTHFPTQEEADQYAADNTLYRAKHILIRTVTQASDGTLTFLRGGSPTNEDGTPYTGTAEEYNAAALEKANGLLAQLGAADDPVSLFDALMAQYSEDPGSAAQPDGYTFGSGEMVEEFEAATAELDCDAYALQPVESAFGYHIILRLHPRPEDLESDLRAEQINALINGWLEAAEIVPTDAYTALDTETFYNNYLDYQQTFPQ